MTRYLVTGASGLLGLNLCLHLAENHSVVGISHREELQGTSFPVIIQDLSVANSASQIIERVKPDVVIHTAAMAIIDDCEKDPDRAMLVNGVLPGVIASVCKRKSIPMLHISTDAVFDGVRGNYTEEDIPNPLSVYAKSKLEGERNVSSESSDGLIARVNFYGWSLRGDRSLAENFYYNLSNGKPMKGFSDVMFCTLFVMNLVGILLSMVEKNLHGIYHTVSSECLSKYDFGIAIARKFGLNEKLIDAVRVSDGGLAAKRSLNLTLNVAKLSKALGTTLPGQAECLDGFWKQKMAGHPENLRGYLKV